MHNDQITRYSRNIMLEGVGRAGQQKLLDSHVTVIGAGGLGSPVLYYLAACGIGRIRIVEFDTLDLTNLQRQILYSDSDTGKPKADLAAERIRELNSTIDVEVIPEMLTASNYKKCLEGTDLVIEGTDRFGAKFLVNDACYFEKLPLITGGVLQFAGNAFFLRPGQPHSPCYRCVFDRIPPESVTGSCSSVGVIGPLAGMAGSTMASMAVMTLLGSGPEPGTMTQYDLKTFELRTIQISVNSDCRLCGENRDIHSVREEAAQYQASADFSLSQKTAF